MNPNRNAPLFRIGRATRRAFLAAALLFPGVVSAQTISASAFNLVELGVAIDAVRQKAHRNPLYPDPELRLAANGLARDMALSQRAWPFAGTGAAPVLRIGSQSGRGAFLAVLVAETWEGPGPLLAQWLSEADSRAVILDRKARSIGLAVQDWPYGKHWVAVYFGE